MVDLDQTAGVPATDGDLERLFQPIELGPVRVRNRIVMTAHNGALPPERYLAYIAARARGGVGLVVAAGANIGVADYGTITARATPSSTPSFDAVPPNPSTTAGRRHFDELVIPLLRARAETVHAAGARCFGQLYHLGGFKEVDDLRPAIGPSARADEEGFGVLHELEAFEIQELVTAHAYAVHRTKVAGMDGAELHAGHGFLINAFLSPFTNRRDDAWGGSADRRISFLEQVLAASRELVGPDYPIGLRITGSEPYERGLTTDDVVAICRRVEHDLTYVSVTSGSVSGLLGGGGVAYAASRYAPVAVNVGLAAQLKSALGLPIIVAGRILTPRQAADVLAAGHCDMVGMTRSLIADPEWASKARAGRVADIRPCISANECHAFHGARAHMVCAVNPRAGREAEGSAPHASRRQRVVIVGAGPAGLEAAQVACQRGHDVVLFERGTGLGGRLNLIACDPSQDRLREYLAYCDRRARSAPIDIRLGTEADAEVVLSEAPDVVVVATGSRIRTPDVPGLDHVVACTATDVLAGAEVEGDVLVVGGLDDHLTPLTIAHLLASRGHPIELVTQRLAVAEHADRITRVAALRHVLTDGVRITTAMSISRVLPGRVVLRNELTGREQLRQGVGSVVFIEDRIAETGLLRELRSRHPRVHAIGDAQAPRRIIHAVLDGQRVAESV